MVDSTKIERVAKAIYEKAYCIDWPPTPYDGDLRSADDWRAMARAAIKAVEEPQHATFKDGSLWRAETDEAASPQVDTTSAKASEK